MALRWQDENRKAAIEGVIEADPVADHVREMMAEATAWTGSASDFHRVGADRFAGWTLGKEFSLAEIAAGR